jgi:hypothetical protein
LKGRLIGLVVLGFLASAPSALAEPITTTVEDPVDDDNVGAHDIVGLGASLDPVAHKLTATVSLREPPAADDFADLQVRFGQPSGDICGPGPGVDMFGPLGGTSAQWYRWEFRNQSSGPATRRNAGSSVTFEHIWPGATPRCVWAYVGGTVQVDETTWAYEHFDVTEWAMLGDPIAIEEPIEEPWTPRPRPPAPPPKRAKLAVLGVGANVVRNRWTTVRVKVKNPGNAVARDVVLTAGKARNVIIKRPVRYWREIAPRATVTAKLRLKLRRNTWVRVPLRVTAAGGLRDRASIHLTRTRF